jgi:hypothetical protein
MGTGTLGLRKIFGQDSLHVVLLYQMTCPKEGNQSLSTG